MQGNFQYYNPTKIYFGKDALSYLGGELDHYGKKILVIYGGGSVVKNGILDKVVAVLKSSGKEIYFDGGVPSNPTTEKLYEGITRARECKADFILAVGGGSVCDYAKAVAVSVNCDDDPWEKYYIRFEEPTCPVLPLGCVLTMAGTGSEMNGTAVITNHAQKLKVGHSFGEIALPKFSILNPEFTYTLPQNQMVSGIYDIMSHILEQYFSGNDDNTSDYIAEGLLRSLINSSRVAVVNPTDYEARSNIMWTATWALNTLLSRGKSGDWQVHMLGQAVAAHTDSPHGLTLSAVSIPYYKYIMPFGLDKFVRYATAVWGVTRENKTDEEIAREGLEKMERWMREIGLVMNLTELGVTPDMIDGIANSCRLKPGSYLKLERDDIIKVLSASL
ncbi:MAG: iron-containing alcohol dehydrogenase [Clostridia bacterium]|nr:iron-containing alcohol dehydrogenase [Clostridia bacterium]